MEYLQYLPSSSGSPYPDIVLNLIINGIPSILYGGGFNFYIVNAF